MLKIYGSRLCPDCVRCIEDLTAAGVEFEYHDFGENLMALKQFLAIRDSNLLFQKVKEAGSIGIPCIVKDHDEITLTWEEFL